MGAVGVLGAMTARYPLRYGEEIARAAVAARIDPALVVSLVRAESSFDAAAVSARGAVGLMQLMPATAAEQAAKIGFEDYELTRPQDNLRLGCAYLAEMLARYGSETSALAAYNAGPARVDAWLADSRYGADGELTDIPYPETARYVERILDAKGKYRLRLCAAGL